MSATVDLDQLRTLRALRYWFGPDQVQVLEVREGVEGEGPPSPRLASQQLALTLVAPPAHADPPVRPGRRPARRATNEPG